MRKLFAAFAMLAGSCLAMALPSVAAATERIDPGRQMVSPKPTLESNSSARVASATAILPTTAGLSPTLRNALTDRTADTPATLRSTVYYFERDAINEADSPLMI